MDYDFSRLTSRSFEHLVQSLAVRVIGPQVSIFGDGADGGREATFEGLTTYGTPPWAGYGVIQAKFRQRDQGRQTSADWALDQFTDELKKYSAVGKRRVPDYYVAATNVVLSPVADRGGKDRLRTRLDEYSRKLGFQGVDIWDFDKLGAYLDDAADIRTAYAAWVAPGDVLAAVLAEIEIRHPAFDQTMRNFLQKELLSDQYANLEQAGHVGDERVPISRVFLDLPVVEGQAVEAAQADHGERETFAARLISSAGERFDPDYRRRSTSTEIAETPEDSGRFVLVGGPGQGKTTIGQFLAQLFRAAILRDSRDSLLDECQLILDALAEDVHTTVEAKRFPIRIVLNDFGRALAAGEANSVLTYISSLIRKRTDEHVRPSDLRTWLSAYPWFIIFDGLDEVPASSNRGVLLRAISDFRVDCSDVNADVLFLATTRPQGYGDDFSPQFYAHFSLLPLNVSEALDYGERFVRVRFAGEEDRQDRVLERLRRAAQDDATSRLLQTPLQITIMTTLVDQVGQPPQERWTLFREYYDVIYRREMSRDIPAAQLLQQYRPDVDAIHREVALMLQVESERSGGTAARMTEQRFADVVEARLEGEGHTGAELIALRTRMIEAAAYRLVFLVGLQENAIGFELRSFQEFLAADGLLEGGDEVVTERLRHIAGVASWRNVFLFGAGKCFAERQYLRDAVCSLPSQINEDVSNRVAMISRAGSLLATDILLDGAARRQPRYHRMLAREAARLMDLPPRHAHTRLATAYSEGIDDVLKEEVSRRVRDRDASEFSGAWVTCAVLADLGVDWANRLLDERFPADSGTREVLLQTTVSFGGARAIVQRMLGDLPYVDPDLLSADDALFEGVDASHVPPWMLAVVRSASAIDASDRTLVPLVFEKDSAANPRFSLSVGSLEAGTLPPLEHIPSDANTMWVAARVAQTFREAPSRSALVLALATLAERFWEVKRAGLPILPWPIAACFAWADDEPMISSAVEHARHGTLGDADDWYQAELRWQREGITQRDLQYSAKLALPYDAQIRDRGFPAEAATWSVYAERSGSFLNEAIALSKDLPPSSVRDHLSAWIYSVFSITFDGGSTGDDKFDWRQILTLLPELRKLPVLMADGLIEITTQPDIRDDEVSLVDRTARNATSVYVARGSHRSAIDELLRMWHADESRVGLLRLAAAALALPTYWMIRSVDTRHGQISEDAMVEESKLVFDIARSAEVTPEALVPRVAANGARIDELIQLLLAYRDVEFAAKVLLGLAANGGSVNFPDVIDGLEEVSRRRMSDLADAAVWQELRLPSELVPFLPQTPVTG